MAANIQVGMDGADFEKGLAGLRAKAANFNKEFQKGGGQGILKNDKVLDRKVEGLIGGLSAAGSEAQQVGVALNNIGGMFHTSVGVGAGVALFVEMAGAIHEADEQTRQLHSEFEKMDKTVRMSAFADPGTITAGISALQDRMGQVQEQMDAGGKHFDLKKGIVGFGNMLRGKSPFAADEEQDAAQLKRAQAREQMAGNLITVEGKLNEIVKLRLQDENEAAQSREAALAREQKIAAIRELGLGGQKEALLIAAAEKEAADRFALSRKATDQAATREHEHAMQTVQLSQLKLSGMTKEAEMLERQAKLRERLQDIARSSMSTADKAQASKDARALAGREQLISDITEGSKPAQVRNAEAQRERAIARANDNAIRRAVNREQDKLHFSDAERDRRIANLRRELLGGGGAGRLPGAGKPQGDPRLDHLQGIAQTIAKLEAKITVH